MSRAVDGSSTSPTFTSSEREHTISSYAGKKAVVTGRTHGIGMAVVKALLDGGAEVLLTGLNKKNVEAARSGLGPRAHGFPIPSPGRYARSVDVMEQQRAPVVLAGDYFNSPTMEAASLSGFRAAGTLTNAG